MAEKSGRQSPHELAYEALTEAQAHLLTIPKILEEVMPSFFTTKNNILVEYHLKMAQLRYLEAIVYSMQKMADVIQNKQ